MFLAVPVARGCGQRQRGGIYLECGLSPNGKPIEHFLMDPPTPIPDDVAIPKQGIGWVHRDGVWHVLDHVGAVHYPNVADFIEEARLYGISRRVPRTTLFRRLTKDSRLLLVHGRAIVTNPEVYRTTAAVHEGVRYDCPKDNRDHQQALPEGEMCAGIWWSDIQFGEPQEGTGAVRRKMPSLTYEGWPHRDGTRYEPGFFASFPIGGIAIVRDDEFGTHETAAQAASEARLPIEVVDE